MRLLLSRLETQQARGVAAGDLPALGFGERAAVGKVSHGVAL
jgi:hypothetical protein